MIIKDRPTFWRKSWWDFRLNSISSLAFDVSLKWDHFVWFDMSVRVVRFHHTSFLYIIPHKPQEMGPAFAASPLQGGSEKLSDMSEVPELISGGAYECRSV